MRGHPERRAVRLVVLMALAAACGERQAILEPGGNAPQAGVIVAAKPGGPSITQVAGGGSFEIDGAAVQVAVTVQNPGRSTLSSTFIVLTVTQGSASRELGNAAVSCDGVAAGVLPAGATCEVSIPAALSSTGGTGQVAAGSASLEASLRQTSGKKAKVLDAITQATSLTGPTQPPPPPGGPVITSVTLGDDELSIDGPAVGASVQLDNPGDAIGGMELQAYVIQDGVRRAAGGTTSLCSTPGTLPPGTCTTPWLQPFASNASSGTGTLTAGAAQLEIQLRDNATVYDSEFIDITLVAPGAASIANLVLPSSTFTIDGDPEDYTITLANVGGARSGVIVQARMVQNATERGAGGTEVQCPGQASGVLPSGGCSFPYYAIASNLAGGSGVLLIGEAELVIDLYDGVELLDSWSETVTLTATGPYIASITLDATSFDLNGTSVGAHVRVINPMSWIYDDVQVVATIYQGAAHRFAGQDEPRCWARRTLESGECTVVVSVQATNATGGDGFLGGGPATLEIVLRQPQSQTPSILDTKTVAITITQ